MTIQSEVTLAELAENIAAYEVMQMELERDHFGKWVVFHDRRLYGIYNTFEEAAINAVENFGRGPYLIREVGQLPITLPPYIQVRTVIDNVTS